MLLPNYKETPLPGRNRDVNGSCVGGFNIGISKYVSEESINAVLEVIKFIASEEEQKKLVSVFGVKSSVINIYNDQEFCKYVDCDFVKNIQGISRPSSNFDNYELYSIKVINIFNKFLYGNKLAKDTLTEIDNITRIHIFSSKYFSESLVLLILLILAFFMIVLSTQIILIPKYKSYFQFMGFDIIIIYTLGSILLLGTGCTYFGQVKEIKCFLRHLMLSLGFTMVFMPILCNLIINFPEQNKISDFVKKRKIYVILCTVAVSASFNTLHLISPFEIKTVEVEDGRNYNTCTFSHIGIFVSVIQRVVKGLFLLLINILIFLEWNVRETVYELRALNIIMGMNWILHLIYIIFNATSIQNFLVSNMINVVILFIFSLSNHFYMFVIRIIFIRESKSKGEEEKFIDKLLQLNNQPTIVNNSAVYSANTPTSTIKSDTGTGISVDSKGTYKNRILNYHYSTRKFSTNSNE
ncbi:hypothetical protein PIROE2DRAFT_64570 [Piromyces sp. E2]|nr:hypothetical protein PIROE2DRAFT_64570 [Piromyces sp. E2]|eukprot:OUM58226.1 hypothetical protein PIROE2DRAFT_64570 [Piromyces sp. E2]